MKKGLPNLNMAGEKTMGISKDHKHEMQKDLTKEKLSKLKDLVEGFVDENFNVSGCRECHETGNGEIVPEDYQGSYDKAIEKLYVKLMKKVK